MSALTDLTQSTGVSQTTLPAWYDTAQQNLVKAGTAAFGAAPSLCNTLAANAIKTMNCAATNPFQQAGATLGSIATGAANPFTKCATTGQMTPNTCTAMGGLFAAQQQQLKQLLPSINAPIEAGNIGTGNFGSLRGETAVDTSTQNALAKLQADQLQAALQNQQTGVSAATGQANVGQQCIANMMNIGQTQMTAPFTNVANAANILGSIKAPETVATTQQVPLVCQIGSATNLGKGALCLLSKTLGGAGGLSSLFNQNSSSAPGGTYLGCCCYLSMVGLK